MHVEKHVNVDVDKATEMNGSLHLSHPWQDEGATTTYPPGSWCSETIGPCIMLSHDWQTEHAENEYQEIYSAKVRPQTFFFFSLPFFRHDLFHQFSTPCRFSVCSCCPGLNAIVTLSTLAVTASSRWHASPEAGPVSHWFVCPPIAAQGLATDGNLTKFVERRNTQVMEGLVSK